MRDYCMVCENAGFTLPFGGEGDVCVTCVFPFLILFFYLISRREGFFQCPRSTISPKFSFCSSQSRVCVVCSDTDQHTHTSILSF